MHKLLLGKVPTLLTVSRYVETTGRRVSLCRCHCSAIVIWNVHGRCSCSKGTLVRCICVGGLLWSLVSGCQMTPGRDVARSRLLCLLLCLLCSLPCHWLSGGRCPCRWGTRVDDPCLGFVPLSRYKRRVSDHFPSSDYEFGLGCYNCVDHEPRWVSFALFLFKYWK